MDGRRVNRGSRAVLDIGTGHRVGTRILGRMECIRVGLEERGDG